MNIFLPTKRKKMCWILHFFNDINQSTDLLLNYLFTEQTCTFLFYLQTISSCHVPFSFTILTINRFCSIIYPAKAFFKTKKFVVICIGSHWIVNCIVSLPFAFEIQPVNVFSFII